MDPVAQTRRTPAYFDPPLQASGKIVEIGAFVAAVALNWLVAASASSILFSYTSLLLFIWLNILILRLLPQAAILLLPVTITRLATCLSLIAIEAGAYMPEVNRSGIPGDASASFVAFTSIFFLAFTWFLRMFERPLASFARSELLERIVALLAAPIVLACALIGVLAALHGLSSGFPLIDGVDRFFYRRYHSNALVLFLLDNKYLVAALLGSVTFSPARTAVLRHGATVTFVALTFLYLLFGDKFFTILTEVTFFGMPFLLQRRNRLLPSILRLTPVVLALVVAAVSLNIYIFSGFGRLPLERGAERFGERFAEQGELWYVASRDYRRVTNWNTALVSDYTSGLSDPVPAAASLRNGVETYFFVNKYAPAKFAVSVHRNEGWVQLTMGYEAMGLVMFGYSGVAVLMVASAALLGFAAAYLRRAFLSGFAFSLALAGWTYLQIYFVVQQAALWPIAAPGQVNRFLLFFVLEVLLFALNRAQTQQQPGTALVLAQRRRSVQKTTPNS